LKERGTPKGPKKTRKIRHGLTEPGGPTFLSREKQLPRQKSPGGVERLKLLTVLMRRTVRADSGETFKRKMPRGSLMLKEAEKRRLSSGVIRRIGGGNTEEKLWRELSLRSV